MRHVDRACQFDEDGSMSITLDQHKTAKSGKYAYMHMSQETFQLLKTYATVVRGTGDNIGDQPVFATPGDEELRHTTINQWLQSTWRK